MPRFVQSYIYIAILATLLALLNLVSRQYDITHPDNPFEVLFLCAAGALLNLPQVRIEQGRLTLVGIAGMAAALVLNPLDATIVGLVSSASLIGRGAYPILGNGLVTAIVSCSGSVIAAAFLTRSQLSLGPRVLAIIVCIAVNLVLVLLAFRIRDSEPIRGLTKKTFTPSFFAAFTYFGLASLVISYVFNGSLLGFFLAAIVCVLALALTDTIAGRRLRRVLESELSDADRHLFHSRAVEGVVHNLRNHIANALGYLKEINPRRLDPVDRESLETAIAAATDAVTVLKSLAQGATPRVTYASDPVDLNELIIRAMGMARPRARNKEILLAVRESANDVKVRADPLLLREVITNLVNNAIDAASNSGNVVLKTGRRNGWPYFSVTDDGPGVSDENRHHLFEPHFTTKEGGTGLGLFMSFGIIKEHQGDLRYEGSQRGGVFTVTLPPYAG
jgi:signal transduction histidine kinase